MRGESLKRLGQIGGHREVRRVIRVEFNDIGTSVLCDHPALQREWDGSIPLAHHIVFIDAVQGPWRDRYRRHKRCYRLRALLRNGPGRNLLSAVCAARPRVSSRREASDREAAARECRLAEGGGRELVRGNLVFEMVGIEAVEAPVAGLGLRVHQEAHRLAG